MTQPVFQIILGLGFTILGILVFVVRTPLAKMPPIGLERWWLEKEKMDPVLFSRRKLAAVGTFFIGLGAIGFVSGADQFLNSSTSLVGNAIIGILLLGLFVTFILYVFSIKKVI